MALVGTYDLLDSTNDWTPLASTGSEVQFVALTDGIYEGEFRLKDGESALSEIFYTVQLANSKLITFIKNKYDYIFINFKVKFKSIDVNERASIIVYANNAEVVAQSWTSQTNSANEELIVNCLLSQGIIEEIINDNYSLKIKFMIEDIDNENFIGTADHIRFTKDVSFYAINRFDIQDRGSNNRNAYTSRWPWTDSTNPYIYSITTKESTITGEKLRMVPYNNNVTYSYYTLTFNYSDTNPVFSSGYPLTLFFNFYAASDANIDDINIRITLDGNYNNGTIIKEIPSLKNSPVEPDYEFDFRTYSGATSITNTGSSTSTTYTAVGYNVDATNFDSIEGAIFNNDTLDSSNNGGDYFTILKNGSTQELWSMDEMDFSIELEFIVYDTTENNQRVFHIGATESNTSGNNNTIQLYITSGGNLIYYIVEGGNNTHTISSVSISSNKLYHVCLTYSETNETAKFYLDGVLIDTYSGVNTTLSNASYFWIGRNLVVNTSDYFNGSVRYFRMWTERELTLNEIKMRYDTLRGIHNIYYTTTEYISSTYSHTLGFYYYAPDYTMNGDYFYIDRILNAAPTAANVFDGGVEVNNTMNVTGNIFNSNLIGEIAMFYQNSSVPPLGYLWCDGSTISTDDDEKYRTLIEILNGDTRGSTSIGVSKSCNLPNYMIDSTGCHLLQAQNSNSLYSNFSYNYQGTESSDASCGNYQLDANYFPSHNHSITNISVTSGTSNNSMDDTTLTTNHNYRRVDGITNVGAGSSNIHNENQEQSETQSHSHNINSEIVIPAITSYPVQRVTSTTTNINTDNLKIELNSSGNNTTNTTHIPVSFKVKYAIKYL